MVIIEVLVYICIVSMILFCLYVINKAQLAKRSDFIYSSVILSLIIIQIFNPISSQPLDSDPPMVIVCIGAILTLSLIYLITRIVISSTDTQEYARKATLSAMFIVFGVIFCVILIDLPETQVDLYRMPLALALCIGMVYYPPALDRLKVSRDSPEQHPETETREDAVLDTATETGMEEHKETEEQRETTVDIVSETAIEQHRKTVINLATESWRLAKVFERTITQLNVDKPRRYISQIEWFTKKAEESLEDVGLRIVNVEGHPYDPGMAATPVNIEDFDIDDSLKVNLMVEPIIMEESVLMRRGKVFLRRIES